MLINVGLLGGWANSGNCTAGLVLVAVSTITALGASGKANIRNEEVECRHTHRVTRQGHTARVLDFDTVVGCVGCSSAEAGASTEQPALGAHGQGDLDRRFHNAYNRLVAFNAVGCTAGLDGPDGGAGRVGGDRVRGDRVRHGANGAAASLPARPAPTRQPTRVRWSAHLGYHCRAVFGLRWERCCCWSGRSSR